MIVITGGAGFIGSNLVAELFARGVSEVVVCDCLGAGEKWRNLAKHELSALIPPEELLEFLGDHRNSVGAIVHLGAISSTTEDNAQLVVSNNFSLSSQLWDWCSAAECRLIYASSAATYGDGASGFDDSISPEYLATLRPLNLYAWSKHLFDRRVARRVAEGRPRPVQWAGLKFFNVYGPNEFHKGQQQSVVVQALRSIEADGHVSLFRSDHPDYPDGGQQRDFIWVGDCVRVILWLLDSPDVSGLFNVGTGKARTFNDLARAVFVAVGRPERIEYVPMPAHLQGRYQYRTEARLHRLRQAGYLQPFTAMEEGIGVYVQQFLLSDDPYR